MPSFQVSSEITLAPIAFWRGMTIAAANQEMWPLVRMGCPADWRHRRLADWTTGSTAFVSTIFLLGLLPIDRHALRFERVDPAHGFLERSSSWANALWQHERSTMSTAMGCVVTDAVTVHSRIPGLSHVLLPVYKLLFRYRHRRMRDRIRRQAPG